MPNVKRPDYVSPHRHSADDVGGLAILFPPTQQAVGVTNNPTRTLSSFVDLDEMDLTFTPPDTAPLWQATVRFNGQFSHDTAGESIQVRLAQDGTAITQTTRSDTAAVNNGTMTIDSQATVLLPAGTSVNFTVEWANSGTGTARADTTRRVLEVVLTPYNPAAL